MKKKTIIKEIKKKKTMKMMQEKQKYFNISDKTIFFEETKKKHESEDENSFEIAIDYGFIMECSVRTVRDILLALKFS